MDFFLLQKEQERRTITILLLCNSDYILQSSLRMERFKTTNTCRVTPDTRDTVRVILGLPAW